MESFSQCPGEVYDSFDEVSKNEKKEISLEELISSYRQSIWYRENTKFRVAYWKESTTVKQTYCKTMQIAIAEANSLIAKGYTVESITTEYPSISDFRGG